MAVDQSGQAEVQPPTITWSPPCQCQNLFQNIALFLPTFSFFSLSYLNI